MNDNILEKDILQFCQETNLVEAIQSLHGPSLVPTHKHGRKAIDGIFLNKTSLSGTKGGFLAFREVTISNHRAVWLDIPTANFGMDQEQPIQRPAGRRLKCQDPRIVQKYNMYLAMAMDIPACLSQLQEVYKDGITLLKKDQLDILETIDKQLTITKLAAEWHCRKFHVGKYPGHLA